MAEIRSHKLQLARNLRKRFITLVRSVSAATAVGLGFGMANCSFGQFGQTGQSAFGQTAQAFGQTGQNFGQTGQTGGIGQTGQAGGLGQTGGLTGGLSGTQAGFGANPFGSGGLAGQASNPFGSTGMMGAANGGGLGGGLGGNLGGLTGAALTNRSLSGMGGMGMGGMGRGGMGRGGQFNQNQNQNSNKPQIRATVKLGFEVATPTNAATSRLINDRMRRIPSTALAGITVEMSGRTAVIRGRVDSPADGKVVERLLSLEPGVDAVKNELTYANGQRPPAKPQPPATNSGSAAARRDVERAAVNASNAGTSAVQAAPEIVPAPGPR